MISVLRRSVNLFSGGASDDKVQTAVRLEGDIIKGYQNNKAGISLPAHINGDGSYLDSLTGFARENNALVLYGGQLVPPCGPSPTLSCTVNSLYYIPQCPPPGTQITDKKGGLACQGGHGRGSSTQINPAAAIMRTTSDTTANRANEGASDEEHGLSSSHVGFVQ